VHEKMKIRNRKITVRLSEKERKFLGEQADAGGMKIEPYIRELIMGNEVKSRPKEEWAEVVRQIAAVGNNINQIAKNTNMGMEATADILKEVLEMQKQVWERVKNL
jgi:uncharacterized protein YgfB (UPF0149 family)